MKMFNSEELYDPLLYNNWNFSTADEWDSLTDNSFYYSNKSVVLFATARWFIG